MFFNSWSRCLLDLSAVQARADAVFRIRQRKSKQGCFGYVLLELHEVYFVEGVGGGVIILHIVRFFLIGDEGGDTFKHEVEVVGA